MFPHDAVDLSAGVALRACSIDRRGGAGRVNGDRDPVSAAADSAVLVRDTFMNLAFSNHRPLQKAARKLAKRKMFRS